MVDALIHDNLFMGDGIYTVSANGDNKGRKPLHVNWIPYDSEPRPLPRSAWFTDSAIKHGEQWTRFLPNTIRVAWLLEPRELHPENYEAALENKDYFHYVVTHDRELANEIGCKAVVAPLGGTRIHPSDWRVWPYKSDGVSCVASDKQSMPGHQLRHELFAASHDEIDWYGEIVNEPLVHKVESLQDYRYQVVIENVSKDNWFTEALLDCFLTGTIPIYWGCTNLAAWGFESLGCIEVSDLSELQRRVLWASSKEGVRYYKSFHQLVLRNFEVAHQYTMPEDYLFYHHPELFGAD